MVHIVDSWDIVVVNRHAHQPGSCPGEFGWQEAVLPGSTAGRQAGSLTGQASAGRLPQYAHARFAGLPPVACRVATGCSPAARQAVWHLPPQFNTCKMREEARLHAASLQPAARKFVLWHAVRTVHIAAQENECDACMLASVAQVGSFRTPTPRPPTGVRAPRIGPGQ